MENSNKETLQPRVLLSWPIAPDYIPPPQFSDRQVTVCPKKRVGGYGLGYVNRREGLVECPEGNYDLYDFVQQSEQIEDKEFDLLIVRASSCEPSIPINTKKLKCPTVLLAGTTHQESFPINYLLAYCAAEDFDYVVTPINRQHLHWFAAAGFNNVAWLPLIHMYTVTHEWVEARENRIAFLGHAGAFHPRRIRLINALRGAGLPLVTKSGTREEGAHLFAHSLISFNCSLNGDFNLRNLEIISAGGFLLTDRLSFASGFDEYLMPGLYCDVYDSETELLEKVEFYLENSGLAIEIARRAYKRFFTDWHPKHRIADLMNWVFKGELPNFYAAKSDPRFFISTAYRDLVNTRLAIYEPVQELHRVEEQLKVLVSKDCPVAVVADLLDLPRLEVYVEAGFPVSEIPKGALSRLHLLEKDLRDERGWDILITKSVERVASSKFVFLLGSENQIVFSNAKKLVDTSLLTLKRRDGYQFRVKVYNDDSTDYIVDQIFNKMCYPILDFVTNVEVIIDIGANIGLASSYFRIFYPNASIYCFELNYEAIHLLKLNSLSIENCYVYPFGLYSDDTTKVFYSGLQTTRHTSVYRSSCVGFPQLAYLRKASHFFKSIDIDKVDILKIDTEGCELQILKDLFEKLSTIKVIYLEFHSEEDRRLIDQLLNPTHVLWRGDIVHAHRGNLCYLNRNCVPKDSPIEPLR